ncbi:class C sortase [Enterococcus pallens]|uniref:Sortase n=1 Tax=Enterococcus pallens ATCC BAA-351 TaxID=1158607 RepID=R2TBP3_9ENTE|nr:class C sortase [Enterococcus pallens]EOH97644.1 sortase [Enterococcus pallens ATCC BAA-351]EOU20937.1 hypothetical protein I588_01784 [Enterococcus pallens ATCC BAA-351]OJG80185.1 sortase [Enterococcus pallens]
MKKWQRKIMIDGLMILILFFGLGTIAYPFLGNAFMAYRDQRIIEQAQEKANKADQTNIAAYQKKMQEENDKLALEGINAGADPFIESATEVDFSKEPDYLSRHTLGVISIPKINVSLPIFDRTTELFLAHGASLLEGTSYPIGGQNTHSVISAHRGLSNAKFFSDLPELQNKDQFYIEIGANVFAYEVINIQVIPPEETEHLRIEEGKDLVTLLTCTPYMVNSHRLLVKGERTELPAKAKAQLSALKDKQKWILSLWLLGLIVAIGFICWLFWRRIKRQIIIHRKYTLYIPQVKNHSLKLYNRKNSSSTDQPISVVCPDHDNQLIYEGLYGGKYTLIGSNNEGYLLWIDKVGQHFFLIKEYKK